MTTPEVLNHSLLRPCILHILRAAGYHATRPSVLDSLTDMAARYMLLLAQTAANHAAHDREEPELALQISVQDVRQAMQDCGALAPEKVLQDQEYDGEEDMRGVEGFLAWATGRGNKEIRRVALEGPDGAKEDYLTVLKRKHATTDDDSRYTGTVLGKASEPRVIKVEGGELSSVKEWTQLLKKPKIAPTITSSRRPSSDLSSLGDGTMEDMEF